MVDNRNGGCSSGCVGPLSSSNGTVCIDTFRVLDSCRDRDCFEDVKILVTAEGQNVLDNSCNIRVIDTEILWVNIALNEVAFNDGFFQVTIKTFVKLTLEGCMGKTRGTVFEGLAVLQKVVILFGGEGNVSTFRSDGNNSFCAGPKSCHAGNTLPTAIVDIIDPIALSSKVVDCSCQCGYCCCSCTEIPEAVSRCFCSPLVECDRGNNLFVSLGIFSVIRIVRPAQILVNGTDFTVPDKECVEAEQDDPCRLFRSLAFPVRQFTGIECDETRNESCGRQSRGCCGNKN